MKKIPSDFALLKKIYSKYYEEFKNYDNNRASKAYVSLDIKYLAKYFKTDSEIIFCRLRYHFDEKYGLKNKNSTVTSFFAPKLNEDENAINFPMLASVLAGMQEENSKNTRTLIASVIAIVISIVSLINSFVSTS